MSVKKRGMYAVGSQCIVCMPNISGNNRFYFGIVLR